MTALSTLLGGDRGFGFNYLAGLDISHAVDTDHDLCQQRPGHEFLQPNDVELLAFLEEVSAKVK